MIKTKRLSEEEIKVITESSAGEYVYIFEYASLSWILREKRVDGEEVKVTDDTNISNHVRSAVKEEAFDPDGGLLDNMDMVTAKQGSLELKKQDTLAKLGEDLAREFMGEEWVGKLALKSVYNEIATCGYCSNEKFCRTVRGRGGIYKCCSDCEEKNPAEIRLDPEEMEAQ